MIGHRLGVRIHDDRLELFLSSTRIVTLPRGRAGATGPNVHVVNYRPREGARASCRRCSGRRR